jgi:hypothetical protein
VPSKNYRPVVDSNSTSVIPGISYFYDVNIFRRLQRK